MGHIGHRPESFLDVLRLLTEIQKLCDYNNRTDILSQLFWFDFHMSIRLLGYRNYLPILSTAARDFSRMSPLRGTNPNAGALS